MNNHCVINASYYCKRDGKGDLILVMNNGAYVLAAYHENTGQLSWQRVIPAGDRKAIEEWLNRNFPANGASTKTKQQLSAVN